MILGCKQLNFSTDFYCQDVIIAFFSYRCKCSSIVGIYKKRRYLEILFGVGLTHCPHQLQDWKGRLLLERSSAVKCPSISYHLAGAKKIQQELAKTGVLERYLSSSESCICQVVKIQIEIFFSECFVMPPLIFLDDFLGSNPSYRCNADIGLGWESLVLYHYPSGL